MKDLLVLDTNTFAQLEAFKETLLSESKQNNKVDFVNVLLQQNSDSNWDDILLKIMDAKKTIIL